MMGRVRSLAAPVALTLLGFLALAGMILVTMAKALGWIARELFRSRS